MGDYIFIKNKCSLEISNSCKNNFKKIKILMPIKV